MTHARQPGRHRSPAKHRRPAPQKSGVSSLKSVKFFGIAVIACGLVPTSAQAAKVFTAAPKPHGQAAPAPSADPVEHRVSRVSRSTRQVHPAQPTISPALRQLAEQTDIPVRALIAYQAAATEQQRNQPGCGIDWEFIAAFGRLETDHGRLNGSEIGSDGIDRPAIMGPALDGSEPGVIGALTDASGNAVRAEGPLQFIPDSWHRWGHGDMQSIDEAALAAAKYLCADGHDLSTEDGRWAAALSYNDVDWYATDIQAIYADYLNRQPAHSFPADPGSDTGSSANPASVQSPSEAAPAPASTAVEVNSSSAAPTASATPTSSQSSAPSSSGSSLPSAVPTSSHHH